VAHTAFTFFRFHAGVLYLPLTGVLHEQKKIQVYCTNIILQVTNSLLPKNYTTEQKKIKNGQKSIFVEMSVTGVLRWGCDMSV
jgi:hypothetical protein